MSRTLKAHAKARALLAEALDRAYESYLRANDAHQLCLAAMATLEASTPTLRPKGRKVRPLATKESKR